MTSIEQTGGMGSNNTQNVNVYQHPDPAKSPSIVATMVQAIAESSSKGTPGTYEIDDDFSPYDISQKLQHNKVVKYHELITHYSEYMLIVENAYDAVEDVKANAKESILKSINVHYRAAVGDLMKSHNISPSDSTAKASLIQDNSDSLIESAINYLRHLCKTSALVTQLHQEDIDLHSQYLAFHAFVECKILEKP